MGSHRSGPAEDTLLHYFSAVPSLVPSNTPVLSPKNDDHSFENNKPFNHTERTFESSFKTFSYSDVSHQDTTGISTFDILDDSFPTKGQIADTLLSFRNLSSNEQNDSNETIPMAFSSSPIPKLNLKFHEPRPLVDQTFRFGRFDDLSDIEDDLGQYHDALDYEDKENYHIVKNSYFNIATNSKQNSFHVTLKLNPRKGSCSPDALLPLEPLNNNKTILGSELFDRDTQTGAVPRVLARQSGIRFNEKSRSLFEEMENEYHTSTERNKRHVMRELKRARHLNGEIPSTPSLSSYSRLTKRTRPNNKTTNFPNNRRKPAEIGRSRNGCWTCRIRKKKCTEERPQCLQCVKLGLTCDGYSDEKPLFVSDGVLQRERLDEIKSITSQRKKVAIRKK